MRLLYTTELRFEEFFDSDIPNHAILSHRWGPEEATYQEFMAIRNSLFRPVLELLGLYLPGWFDIYERISCSLPGGFLEGGLSSALSIVLMTFDSLNLHPYWVLVLSFLLVLAWIPATIVRPKPYKSGYSKILASCKRAASD